jgi:hypothetical protein
MFPGKKKPSNIERVKKGGEKKKHHNHSPATNILLKGTVEPQIMQPEEGLLRTSFLPTTSRGQLQVSLSRTDEKLEDTSRPKYHTLLQ